jgi:hypothetical protein
MMGDARAMIAVVKMAHADARPVCARTFTPDHDPTVPYHPDPRSPCGDLSEPLWNASDPAVAGFVRGLYAASDRIGAGGGRSVLSGVNCMALSGDDYAAAVHMATTVPAWTSAEFLRCAIGREREESFALWSLLSSVADIDGAREWVADRQFVDARTLRRVERLRWNADIRLDQQMGEV